MQDANKVLSVRSVGSCRAIRPASPIRKMTALRRWIRATAAGSEQASFQTRSCTGPLKDDLLAKIEIGNRRCHRLTSCGSPHFRYDVVNRVQRSYFLDRDIDKALRRMALDEEKNLTETVNDILRRALEKYL